MEKIRIDCEVRVIAPALLDIYGNKNFEAVLEYEADEEGGGARLMVFDSTYFKNWSKFYDELFWSDSNIFEIIPKNIQQFGKILSIELEHPHTYDMSYGAKPRHNYYTIQFKKMKIVRESYGEDNAEAYLLLSNSALEFFDEELYYEDYDDFDKQYFKLNPNREAQEINIDNVVIRPSLELIKKNVKRGSIKLIKKPSLKVSVNSEDWTPKHEEYCEVYLSLLSLYAERYICSWFSSVNTSSTNTQIYDLEKKKFSRTPSMFKGRGVKSKTIYDYILDANMVRCIKFLPELKTIVESRIRAYHSDGINQFMMQFVIIEMIKDLYNKENSTKAGVEKYEFKFTKSNKEVNKIINEALDLIQDIVHEDERCIFIKKRNGMIPNIKTRAMKSQFDELFAKLGIDVQKRYNFDINHATELRNKIFHGQALSTLEKSEMRRITLGRKMSALANDLIHSFFLNTYTPHINKI